VTSRAKKWENLRSKSPSAGPAASPDSRSEEKSRTISKRERQIGLTGIPDTVNTARVEKLAEKYGPLVNVTLHHERGSAIVEFVDASSVGRLEMHADELEFDGQKVELVPVQEVDNIRTTFKASTHKDKTVVAKSKSGTFTQKGGPDHRSFARPKNRLGATSRGGLGFKRSEPKSTENGETKKKPMSNADFRAMFLPPAKKEDKKSDQSEPAVGADDSHLAATPEEMPMDDLIADGSNENQKHSVDEEMIEAPEDIPLDDLLAGDDDDDDDDDDDEDDEE
jgi:Occluded RNA-recognition motif/Lsm interaction motif